MPRATVRDTERSYIKIRLDRLDNAAASDDSLSLDLLSVRQLIASALQENNGSIGGGIHIDVLLQSAEGDTVVIACATPDLPIVREALSSYTSKRYQRHCRVIAVAHHLASLA